MKFSTKSKLNRKAENKFMTTIKFSKIKKQNYK